MALPVDFENVAAMRQPIQGSIRLLQRKPCTGFSQCWGLSDPDKNRPLPDEFVVTKGERRETEDDLVDTKSDSRETKDDLVGVKSDFAGTQVGFFPTGVDHNALEVHKSSRISNRAWDDLGTPADLGGRSGIVICRT